MIKSWKEITTPFLSSDTGSKIKKFIEERRKEVVVYPDTKNIMRAFKDETCSPDKIRMVIIGQDPYHNGAADGLAFSSNSAKRPESLKNIFKELHNNLYSYMKVNTWEEFMPQNTLSNWAKQGVLLMNTVLSVEEGKPNSHSDIGWQEFTSSVIEKISNNGKPLIFMLWGKHAQSLKPLIKGDNHLILEAPHPSPFSANKGFIGCKHFSEAHHFMKHEQAKYFELKSTLIDMKKYVDIDGIIENIKDTIIRSSMPLDAPNERLTTIKNFLDNDYFWEFKYGINYSTN